MCKAGRQILLVMAHPIIAGSLPNKAQGFTYLLVLGFVLVMLLSLSVSSEHIALTQQREREAELIFIGKQYQQAIASYYHQSPDGLNTFPTSLDALVNDSRSQVTTHHLRKHYRDPIRNTFEWGLIKDAFGNISGVYSLSNQMPVKTNVDFLQSTSNHVASYADWRFEYVPSAGASGIDGGQAAEPGDAVLGDEELDNAMFTEEAFDDAAFE